ncbi:MAG: hypothetical protein WD359_08420 [Dehalococcoidia bacterium]
MTYNDDQSHDGLVTRALTRFAHSVVGDGVTVDYRGGIASIRGRVASATQARALEDLIRHHDEVSGIESELRIDMAAAAMMRRAD